VGGKTGRESPEEKAYLTCSQKPQELEMRRLIRLLFSAPFSCQSGKKYGLICLQYLFSSLDLDDCWSMLGR
jgi:hypothetical protein